MVKYINDSPRFNSSLSPFEQEPCIRCQNRGHCEFIGRMDECNDFKPFERRVDDSDFANYDYERDNHSELVEQFLKNEARVLGREHTINW